MLVVGDPVMLFDDTHAVMGRETFEALPTSTSYHWRAPTRWKAQSNTDSRWMLGEWTAEGQAIHWRDILVVE